ncbi:60Kd inner membrane protein-domain-containing protein [Bombardia bombarda]|uniref:60Kd inner membrane protein-domain-containing protein n=1 Tax=Bombardia bombarda TaxID=252184 RepID=A0AA39XL96_9PEZI|nr:60Kd inner membrane protein-domain-containing protein [Bombardia bombarda]
MLPSRGLLRSSPSVGLAKVALQRSSSSPRTASRQFGTSLRSNATTTISLRGAFTQGSLASSSGRRVGGSVAITAATLPSLRQVRYASTQPSEAAAPAAAGTVPPVDANLVAPQDLSSIIDLSGSDLLNMPEQIGFLKALGLDYGWGPTALMEWSLEHIYIYTGLPWWASLGVLALGIRLVIFKPSLDAAIHSQKSQDLRKNPKYEAAMAVMKENMMKADGQLAMAGARSTISKMNKAAGLKQWKAFIPMLNLPLGYGVFRLFRGMAALPVPSLETGGALWFTDLTVCDPFYILPIATAGIMYAGLRMAIPHMAPAQQQTMKIVSMVMLPVSLMFTIYIPAGIQLYFFTTGALHTFQNWVFYQNWFRRIAGLPPLVTPGSRSGGGGGGARAQYQAPRVIDVKAKVVPEEPKKSLLSTVGGGMAAAKDKFTSYQERSTKEKSFKEAKAYEEKRALEEKEKLVARREMRKQMKKRRTE